VDVSRWTERVILWMLAAWQGVLDGSS
jgi:hypothetical protein